MRQSEESLDSYKAVVESVLSSRMGRLWLGRADFAVLRMLMLLAAVDGEVSSDELDYFRSVIDGYTDSTLDDRKAGGLGIFLVRELCEPVAYERKDGQNVLTVRLRELSGDRSRRLSERSFARKA